MQNGYSTVSGPLRQVMGVDTNTALAEKLGITAQAVTQWDTKGWLPPRQAFRIHRAHGISLELLAELVGEDMP